MVQIIRDPEVVRRENYNRINKIMYPDFYLSPAGTATCIYDKHGSYRGQLFLNWDNHEVQIKGTPEEFWNVANRIEEYGYEVTIESPHNIDRYELGPRRNVTTQRYLLPESNHVSVFTKIKNIIW